MNQRDRVQKRKKYTAANQSARIARRTGQMRQQPRWVVPSRWHSSQAGLGQEASSSDVSAWIIHCCATLYQFSCSQIHLGRGSVLGVSFSPRVLLPPAVRGALGMPSVSPRSLATFGCSIRSGLGAQRLPTVLALRRTRGSPHRQGGRGRSILGTGRRLRS